jgi:DNA-binding transcriptional LysR family regulator
MKIYNRLMKVSERVFGVDEFLAVAAAGSFVAASEKLGLTPSAVGKAVQRLEQRLGARLFTRTTRRVEITEEGSLFRERCEALVRDLDFAEAEVDSRRNTLTGLIRLNTPVAYGRVRVLPIVSRFLQQQSEIRVEAQLSDKVIDPIEERVDVLVRIGELDDSSMWARQIDDVRLGVFASPAYMRANKRIRRPSDLANHQRLGFRLTSGKTLQFALQDRGIDAVFPPSQQFSCSDIEGTLVMCEQGLGLAYLPTFIAEQSLAAGRIVPVLAPYWISGAPVHVICPQPRHIPRRVRALADVIVASIAKAS